MFLEAEDLGHQTFMAAGVGGYMCDGGRRGKSGGEQHEKWMNFERKGTIYSETDKEARRRWRQARGVTSCVLVHVWEVVSCLPL